MSWNYCPRCGNTMHKSCLMTPNVSYGKNRKVQVYICRSCGYRATKDEEGKF